MKGRIFKSAAVMLLETLSGTVCAKDAAFELPTVSGAYIKDHEWFKLAANDKEILSKKPNDVAPEVKKSEFEPSWLTGGKVHQYLGLATIAGAALTALAAPDDGCEKNCTTNTAPRQTNGTHAKLAKATVAMAAATIATGLIVHWDDIHLDDGFTDPDNLHVMFGVTGAALMAYAVNKSKNSATPVSHAGIAELGALGMVVAIKLTW
jgi:hypothetical protein